MFRLSRKKQLKPAAKEAAQAAAPAVRNGTATIIRCAMLENPSGNDYVNLPEFVNNNNTGNLNATKEATRLYSRREVSNRGCGGPSKVAETQMSPVESLAKPSAKIHSSASSNSPIDPLAKNAAKTPTGPTGEESEVTIRQKSSKRSSDGFRRRSGNFCRRFSSERLSQDISNKRNSDPVASGSLAASIASFRNRFAASGDGLRSTPQRGSDPQNESQRTTNRGSDPQHGSQRTTNRGSDRRHGSQRSSDPRHVSQRTSDHSRHSKRGSDPRHGPNRTSDSSRSSPRTSDSSQQNATPNLTPKRQKGHINAGLGPSKEKDLKPDDFDHRLGSRGDDSTKKVQPKVCANDLCKGGGSPKLPLSHSKSAILTIMESPTSATSKSTSKGKSFHYKFFHTPKKSSNDSGKNNQVDGSAEKKWTRSGSQRRPFHRSRETSSGFRLQHQDPSALSDTEVGKISASGSLLDGDCVSASGSVTSERAIDAGRVSAWATSFEKLLEDPAGRHTFAEFLKKEYSHENIYFWTACERYKRLSSPDQLQATAKAIFERHLCVGASEPVNVDSQARQNAQDSLHDPDVNLFSQAQKQIFNLMKFDSYSRFLKSTLYQDCLSREMRGQTLPYPGDETLDPDLQICQDDAHITLKKSKSDADERRRRSLLPWHRKDRSKSKDRGEAEYRRMKKSGGRNTSDSSSLKSDLTGSRSSLNSSSDLPMHRRAISKESLTSGELGSSLSGSEGCSNRCRVVLPDLSNSVVALKPGESVQDLLTRLLERRGISFSTFDVYHNKTDRLIDKTEESLALGGMEVRIEQRIIFRLDLPNRKTVCVKAKPNRLTSEVLKPILHKYGYKLDLMAIHRVGEEKCANLKTHVNEIDGDRLVVQTKEEVKEWGIEPARQKRRPGSNGDALEEITNLVFQDLLKGKLEQNFDELGVLDFDARSTRTDHSNSDRSSSATGSYGVRNSAPVEKEMNRSRKIGHRSSVHENIGSRKAMMLGPDHQQFITKRRPNNNNNSTPNNNDELYEGLKRAQRSRIDDQRGTEINFELPDFLKKNNQPEDKENQLSHLRDQLLLARLERSFPDSSSGHGCIIPTHQEAEEYFSMAHPEVWGGSPPKISGGDSQSANATLVASDLQLGDEDEGDSDARDFDQTLVAEGPSIPSSPLVDAKDNQPPHPPPPPATHPPPPPSRIMSSSLQMSPPPPPLPPKPKLGGAAARGPPPRPPSRQLPILNPPAFTSSASEDDDPTLRSSSEPPPPPPLHLGGQSRQQSHHHHHHHHHHHDKYNISFV